MTSLSKSCFALVISGLVVVSSAAQSAQKNTTRVIILSGSESANCPVAMSAKHGVDGSMVTVNKAPHGFGQQLELTLSNPGSTAISAIRITVHGWNGHGRTFPAAGVTSDDTTASQTLELKIPIAPHTSTKTSLWVSGLTSVDSIDLVEVHYAKGLTWRAPAVQACHIAPDGMMLVSHR